MQATQPTIFHFPPPVAKLYDLIWNGQTVLRSAPYPVCNGKKTELSKSGWNKNLFTIKRHA